jgi:hypothetical protein
VLPWVWCKLVFLGGRGGVVPAALVGFAVVLVAWSSSALAPSSKASSSPVVRGSSSVIVAVAAHGGHCSSKRFTSVDQTILVPGSCSMSRPSVVVR